MAEEGNGKGTFWKVIGVVGVGVLTWIGSQLLVIPTHAYQLQSHETRITEVERQQAAARAATNELIELLKSEARERERRNRR